MIRRTAVLAAVAIAAACANSAPPPPEDAPRAEFPPVQSIEEEGKVAEPDPPPPEPSKHRDDVHEQEESAPEDRAVVAGSLGGERASSGVRLMLGDPEIEVVQPGAKIEREVHGPKKAHSPPTSSSTLGTRGIGRGGGGTAGVGSLGGGKLWRHHSRGAEVRGYGSNLPRYYRVPAKRRSTESFRHYGTNSFTDPIEDPYSTFGLDVDTGSYTIARRRLTDGFLPHRDGIRVEEFVNYFSYDYPEPDDDAFSVSLEAAPSPFATQDDTYLVRVGVQGKEAVHPRKPVHLVFLVDVSGSMRRPRKLELAKSSLTTLTENLGERDTVAIVTYASESKIVLPPTTVRERATILEAVRSLSASGGTAMSTGLDLAYQLAEKHLVEEHENRVIVLSDGDPNLGTTSLERLNAQIARYAKKGVTLSTIGFGIRRYRDVIMEQLANRGNGNYFYVDSQKESDRIFGRQLDGTLQVIARDVKIQVEFNPEAVERYRLIGYENRDIADDDFRDDAVDAGELGAGHTVTALYEVIVKDQLAERVATVRVRHKEPRGSERAVENTFALDRDELRRSIGDSSKDFQFAAAVCAFAEKLRGSPYAEHLTWGWIEEIASSTTRQRADRKELVRLIQKARERS